MSITKYGELYLKRKEDKFMPPAVRRVRDYIIEHHDLFDSFRTQQ